MERIPTKLIVEKGQVFTTDKPMPERPITSFEAAHYVSANQLYEEALAEHNAALESWKKEAYPIGNGEWYCKKIVDLHYKNVPIPNGLMMGDDGIYDCPDGLVFEVVEEPEFPGFDHTSYPTFKQVAILSFKEPSKETDMNKGKLCTECGKTMCENFINHGSCGDVPDWTSLAYQPDHKFFKDNITADGKISITPVTKEPSSERPDFEAKVEFYREQTAKLREYLEVNRIGRANQNLFEALYDHVKEQREKIQSLEQEIERLREGMSGVVNWIQKVGVDNAIRGSVIIQMIEELKSKLKEVKRIRITKLKEAENPVHPNNISEGFTLDGDFIAPPTIGERFYVGTSWSTSLVQEIISHDTFRTFNSIYRIEPID